MLFYRTALCITSYITIFGTQLDPTGTRRLPDVSYYEWSYFQRYIVVVVVVVVVSSRVVAVVVGGGGEK